MNMSKDKDITKIEDRLRADETELPTDWNRLRGEFAEMAATDGLIDISYEVHDSPFGPLVVGATDAGIVRIGLSAESEEEVIEDLARRVSVRILKTGRPEINSAREQLDEYFDGGLKRFKLKLDWQLARGFRRDVLAATNRIPYGKTSSYRDVATKAGSPKAVRAAGSALATNPLPIIVPCHRVLRSDGHIGAYLGGTSMKESLLQMESGSASA
jgi:methylated-DNA-[protein]-cysteine S-methyltransferase